MKIKIGYFIILLQLVLVFLANFINRFLKGFDQTVQLSFSLFFFIILVLFYYKKVNTNTAILIVFSTLILLIGVFKNQFLINVFQLILIVSNFVYIFFSDKIDKKSIDGIIKVILIFSFLQLFFDFAFPKNVIDLNDQFSGTFVMANNKSRFLFFILPFAYFLPNSRFLFNKFGKIIFLTTILLSAYLGFSTLGLLLFIISFILAFFIKRISTLIFIYLIVFFSTPALIKHYYIDRDDDPKHYSHLEMNYKRFYDEEHGVKAIYLYGFKELSKTYYTGIGFGNFSSRAGQLFDSKITKNIPKQLIKIWAPLFSTKAPYGLSSLYVLIVELGFLSLIPIFILFKWMNKLLKQNNFYLSFMVIYAFFILNYNPTFFEFNESFIYFITLTFFSKLIIFSKNQND